MSRIYAAAAKGRPQVKRENSVGIWKRKERGGEIEFEYARTAINGISSCGCQVEINPQSPL